MVRSMLHGFVSLEVSGGFGLPREVDRSFAYAIKLIDAGLRGSSRK